MTQHKVKISALEKLALDYSEEALENEIIRQNNLTKEYQKEKKNIIKNKEVLNIQIIGKPTTGKSTVAINEATDINENLLNKKMTIKNICADQLEYSRKMLQENPKNICLVTDEWNSLSQTGENSTTEEKLLKHFSDVMAQHYVHRYSCSPEGITDHNANIILETIAPNRNNNTTTCLIYIRLIKPTGTITQLIGHVIINVTPVLNKKYYQQYRKRKFQKMNLVLQEGIKDIREMEQAQLVLTIYDQLKGAAKQGFINRTTIGNFLEIQKRKNKRFMSILGTRLLEEKLEGILNMEKNIEKIRQRIQKMKKQNFPKSDIKELQRTQKELQQGLCEIIADQSRLININKKYQNL